MADSMNYLPPPPYEKSAEGVAISVFAFLAILMCIPPLVWHARNSNFSASCLIVWFIVLNFFNFVNSLIWPTDNIASWWEGYGYCDIHAKLLVGTGVGVAGALVCIFRSLAKVMDTDNAVLIPTKADKRRNLAFEIVFCVVIPLVIMAVHYVVQESRYLLYSIAGCMPSYHQSWVSLVLGYMWPPIVLMIAAVYCGLVVYRLFKYRNQFSYIVSCNSTTSKSRFIRLMALSSVMLLGSLPVQLYVLYFNITAFQPWAPYSWDVVHSVLWGEILKYPMFGKVFFDRWIHVTAAFLLFGFFGFGKDATLMYRAFLLKLGLGRWFPSLKHPHIAGTRQSSSSTRVGSFSGRSKWLHGRKNSESGLSSICSPVRSNSDAMNLVNADSPDLIFASSKPLPPVPALPVSHPSTVRFHSSSSRALSETPANTSDDNSSLSQIDRELRDIDAIGSTEDMRDLSHRGDSPV